MRLLQLNQRGGFELFNYTDDKDIPRYAILSHTWLSDDDEVRFEDLADGSYHLKAGCQKIRFCGQQAATDGIDYFWVDTCCIDKSSSTELGEAIISMFQWPKLFASMGSCISSMQVVYSGLTLQELIAPTTVHFFSAQGTHIGDRNSLEQIIHERTGIPKQALRGEPLSQFSFAERLSWAEPRETKRREDKAYSLLGILEIFMPLMYGEGDNAFKRLQQEVDMKHTENANLERILSKLPTAPQAAFNSFDNQYASTCLSNTRVEILREIMDWADGDDKRYIYWLNGMAGTGKSTIARTVARKYFDQGSLGGSFFFSRGGGDVGLAQRLITTLASQLAARIPAVKHYICDVISQTTDIGSLSLRDQWDQLIANPLSRLIVAHSSICVLVVDALDECDNERDIQAFLELLARRMPSSKIKIRIFVTSRPEIFIRSSFARIPETERQVFVLQDVQPTIVDRDLTLFFSHQFETIRVERGFSSGWPGPRTIRRFVEMSCGLFIWASTACRFIEAGKRFASRRIDMLINDHHPSLGPEKKLDHIYMTVLKNSIQQGYNQEEKEEVFDMLREVLGSLVTLISPLSADSLAHLLNRTPEHIGETLVDLHTIFHIPSQSNRPIRPHHPTFRDFLLDKHRCGDLNFWVEEKLAHKTLADNCVTLMSQMLKTNICSLPSPGVLVTEIDHNHIELCIPQELQYACLYWVQHYRQSGVRLQDDDYVHKFFEKHFLHWLEVINLIGKGPQAAAIIRMYQSLLGAAENLRQIPYVKDARRFIFAFHSIIEQAPIQTYCAALVFIPSTNELKTHFWGQINQWMKDVRMAEAVAPKVKDEYNYVNDIAFTPNGLQVASGTTSPVVRLWDVTSKTTCGIFEGQTDKVSSVSISPDGTMIASGSDDATVMVWDFQTRAILYTLKGHSSWVNSVKFSPNGKLLASASMDETIRLADAVSGEAIDVLEGNTSCINAIAFSPDSTLLLSGSADYMVRLWDLEKKDVRLVLDGHSGVVNSVCFSPNGKQVLSGSDDTTCRIFDLVTGSSYLRLLGHQKKVTSVAYSPDGCMIASGSDDKTVRVWSGHTGEILHVFTGHTSGINAVTFSPSSRLLTSGSFNDEIRMWDILTGDSLGILDEFEDEIKFSSPSDQQIAVTGLQEMLSSDSLETVRNPVPYHGLKGHAGRVSCVVVSPHERFVATGSDDGVVKLWSQEGRELWKFEGHLGGITCLCFSPDSRYVASASIDKSVKVWDTNTGSPTSVLSGHSDSVYEVNFSPDGCLLATCSADCSALLWDTVTWKALNTILSHFDAVKHASFSSDSRCIATCSKDKTIKLWIIGAGFVTLKSTLRGHTEMVNSVNFSSDGRFLVSASKDTTVRVWDRAGATCGILRGHTLPANDAAFSPDDDLIVSCSEDETVKIWNWRTELERSTLNVDIVIRRVSFSSSSQRIETDRGAVDIDKFTSSSALGEERLLLPTNRPHSLFVTSEWVRRNIERTLWLPVSYRATSIATCADICVLGHSSGSLSFIYF